jgi:hypothetical protein
LHSVFTYGQVAVQTPAPKERIGDISQ